MTPLPENLNEVSTHAQLYDLLQLMFGIGFYDESQDAPWHKSRMAEIAKLKGMCRRRRVTVHDVVVAAWYARETGKPVSHTGTLFALMGHAKLAYVQMRRTEALKDERQELDAAIGDAIEHGEDDWAEQLLRAAPGNVRSLLDTYSKEHR